MEREEERIAGLENDAGWPWRQTKKMVATAQLMVALTKGVSMWVRLCPLNPF